MLRRFLRIKTLFAGTHRLIQFKMPRTYKQKTDRVRNTELLFTAIEVIKKECKTIRDVANSFGLPYETLRRNYKKSKDISYVIGVGHKNRLVRRII